MPVSPEKLHEILRHAVLGGFQLSDKGRLFGAGSCLGHALIDGQKNLTKIAVTEVDVSPYNAFKSWARLKVPNPWFEAQRARKLFMGR